MVRTSKAVSDRVFYTVYRFFEEVHGPGDAAEVAAIFTWCFLLLTNILASLILLFVIAGRPQLQDSLIPYVFGGIGTVVSATQYFRYLSGDRLRKLYESFAGEPVEDRSRRRWAAFGFSMFSVIFLASSLLLLSK